MSEDNEDELWDVIDEEEIEVMKEIMLVVFVKMMDEVDI